MKQLKHSLFVVVIALLLASCGKKPFYEKVYDFDGNEWNQDQKAVFKVKIDDTTAVYRFQLTLRTTTNYEYNNVWLFWNSETPDKEKVREPFELKITTPEGAWIGKNSGTIVENQLNFADKKISIPGEYVFTIEQAATQKILKNVLDLGLTIYKQQ
jgi:gliding motility-associated lipoprotein GldH